MNRFLIKSGSIFASVGMISSTFCTANYVAELEKNDTDRAEFNITEKELGKAVCPKEDFLFGLNMNDIDLDIVNVSSNSSDATRGSSTFKPNKNDTNRTNGTEFGVVRKEESGYGCATNTEHYSDEEVSPELKALEKIIYKANYFATQGDTSESDSGALHHFIYELNAKEKMLAVLGAVFVPFMYFVVNRVIRLTFNFLKFIWYRSSIRKAWLEATDKKLSSVKDRKSTLERAASKLSEKIKRKKEKLEYIRKEVNEASSYLKKCELCAKDDNYAGAKDIIGEGINFVKMLKEDYKKNIRNEIDKEVEAYKKEDSALKRGTGGTLTHNINDLREKIKRVDEHFQNFANGLKKLEQKVDEVNKLLACNKEYVTNRTLNLKDKVMILAKDVDNTAKKYKSTQDNIDKLSKEIKAIENDKNYMKNRSFCGDFCIYLTQQQQ